MKRISRRIAWLSLAMAALGAALAPTVHAQSLGSTVRIWTKPDGAYYSVDGTPHSAAMSAIWPAGGTHVLSVDQTLQLLYKTKYQFVAWLSGTQAVPGGGSTISVVADPSITEYHATFEVSYALSLNFYACAAGCDNGPGRIVVNDDPTTAYTHDQDIWFEAGSNVKLTAVPSPGYTFVGWVAANGQVVTGPVSTVTMNAPTTVYPKFAVTRNVTLTTVPAGLEVLADRTPVATPVSYEWGYNTVHSVGPVSPQQDASGKWWIFGSWSDGGAASHAYTVAPIGAAINLTATYTPGAAVDFATSPAGLKLKIDGRDNWLSYNFLWGVGETHHVEAPTPQTDAKGRTWVFVSWSNGASAVEDVTVPDAAAASGMNLVATYAQMGHLSVTSTVSGLSVKVDGTDCATPCDVDRPLGTAVAVSAPASLPLRDGVREDFNGWPGSGSTAADYAYTLGADPVKVNLDYHVMNRLAAQAVPSEGASWSIQPSSADGFYDAQSTVTVGVSARPGFRFRGWAGDLSGSKPMGVVAMNQPRAVEADLDRVPYIAPTGILNGAGTTPVDGVAPGSVFSIFGASLAADTVVGPASPLAQTLDGLVVKLGDRMLPLFFVSPTQINAQLPDDWPPGDASLTVSATGQPDVKAGFTVVRNAPGLFGRAVDTRVFAVALHEDGSAVTEDAPAIRGELLTVYGTGLGPTDHPRPAGFAVPAEPAYPIVDAVSVLIGDAPPADATAFAAPGRVAVDAIQFRVAADGPASGNAQLVVRVNGQDSNSVLLPIQ